MSTKIYPLALLFVLASCFTPLKIIPLKGHYVETPFQVESKKTREEVWSNIIDFFGQRGIGIKIIDKSSWLIISDQYPMPFSYENSKGQLYDPEAFLVIRKVVQPGNAMGGPGGNVNNPTVVSAEWNIILKEVNGKTVININIVNPRYKDALTTSGYGYEEFRPGDCFSTGVFEKKLAEIIK